MKQTIPTYRLSLLLLLGLMTGRMSFAQSQSGPLTLQQCIQYGLSNNAGVLKSKLEVERSEDKKGETRSAYLPQVNASVSAIDNLKLQTMILPGEFIGQPGTKVPVQFGTKYNITAGVDATQVLYNQQLIGSMKITEQSTKISEINSKKTEEQLVYDIASAYYAAQVSLTQKTLVESNLHQVDTLLELTRVKLQNGFATQLDVDRLVVSQTNLRTDLASSETSYQQQLMLLKYYMGMPLETVIELPVITGNEPAGGLISIETLNRTDLDLIQAQKDLYALNLKQIKYGYIPTLSLTFHSAVQLQQNDLRIFDKDADWFPLSYVGLNLNIPIFDGLQKNYQVKQTNLQLQQAELDEKNLTESLKMQRANASNSLTTNRSALESQQRNVELAQKVYETTQAQYVGGIASMTDLVNAETSLRSAQTNYLRALVQVKLAELDLIKTTGNISSLN
jgi:outer membrane protein